VTNRTNWDKVFRGINQVAGASFKNRHNVVNVFEIAPDLTISLLKQKITGIAPSVFNAD